MPNKNQVTGRCFITVSGTRQASKEGAKLHIGGVSRTGVAGDSGVHGYTEKTEIPFIEFTISHKADTDMVALAAWTNETATFQTDTGQTYLLRNAWMAKPPELSKGEVSLRLEGMSCEKA
jgi:hypothetical protein